MRTAERSAYNTQPAKKPMYVPLSYRYICKTTGTRALVFVLNCSYMNGKSDLHITHAMATLATHLLNFDREILGEKSSCATNDASVNSDTNTHIGGIARPALTHSP